MNLEELVAKAKVGDNFSKEEILNKFKSFIIKFCRSIFIRGYETEDLMQIGYMALIKAIEKFDINKNNNFVSYATNAMKNNFYYEIRQKSKLNAESSLNIEVGDGIEIIENLEGNENIEDEFLLKEDIIALLKALNSLSKEEKDFIEFVYFQERKITEYAELHNLKYITCAKRKGKILKKLRKLLES